MTKTSGIPFQQRLEAAYYDLIAFHTLEFLVYPPSDFPRYWRYSCNGGPPGGRMAFVAALTRRKIRIFNNTLGVRTCYGTLNNTPSKRLV